MGRKGRIKLQEINTGFDFTTDCPFWKGFWDSGGKGYRDLWRSKDYEYNTILL